MIDRLHKCHTCDANIVARHGEPGFEFCFNLGIAYWFHHTNLNPGARRPVNDLGALITVTRAPTVALRPRYFYVLYAVVVMLMINLALENSKTKSRQGRR